MDFTETLESGPPCQLLFVCVSLAQDEKALSFFVTVPQEWRLFWLINLASLSYVLALAGIFFLGNPSALSSSDDDYDDDFNDLDYISAIFVLGVNPAVTTFLSFTLSRLLRALCETRDTEGDAGRKVCLRKVVWKGAISAVDAVKSEPWFYVVLSLWFSVPVTGLAIAWQDSNYTEDLYFFWTPPYFDALDDDDPVVMAREKTELIAANVSLAAGLLVLVFRSWRDRAGAAVSVPGPQPSFRRGAEPTQTGPGNHYRADPSDDPTSQQRRSRVPSLLVGWGLGYWLGSFLLFLGIALEEGDWSSPRIVAIIVGYVVLPSTFLLGVLLVADSNVFGNGLKRVLRPAADAVQNEAGVSHWMMVTVLRDLTSLWLVSIMMVPW